MEFTHEGYLVSDDKARLQPDAVYQMLTSAYWAEGRTRETLAKSIEHSLCFGIYKDGEQVAFARCVTDYSVMYWLGDVIVSPAHRGKKLGEVLVGAIVGHPALKPLVGYLQTKDAHGLYQKYGFVPDADRAMRRTP